MPYDGTTLSDTARHLIAARDHLARHGWCQNDIETSDGRVCAVGAMQAVGGHTRDVMRAFCAATGEAFASVDGASIGFWSDEPSRTRKEVIAVFNRAVALVV